MLSIQEIEKFYPAKLQKFKRHILREYLQYRILASIFRTPQATKLSFLGGTALRLIYNNNRFSEDLDFDHFGLSEPEFQQITTIVQQDLKLEGYDTEMRHVAKGAYRCYVKFPNLLFENKLSLLSTEKILIQLDSAAHGFNYTADKKTLNSFDVFTKIFVTPLDILLSQKIYAALNRKRPKGRDFFDIVFLSSRTKPNYSYLTMKLGVDNAPAIKQLLHDRYATFNFTELVHDVESFLFSPQDTQRITLFMDFLHDVAW